VPFADPEAERAYQKAYRERTREHKGAMQRAYHATHREQRREWYERTRDERIAKARIYRAAHREEMAARNKAWREANREHLTAYQKARRKPDRRRDPRHGLTAQGVDALYEMQHEACAICDAPIARYGKAGAHVDHDHASGEPRGLLCRNCNVALPAIEEHGGSWVLRALAYLADPPTQRLPEPGRVAAVGADATDRTVVPFRVANRRKEAS